MFKQLLELFTKQFIKKMGRSPMTAAEMMSIQNQVVNLINKTKGKIPLQKESKSPFQGFTPRVIEGGKGKAGIGTLLKDSPEAIAKIKADNKAAAERLRNKKKTVEDFSAEGDWDPSGMASGGIAGQLHLNRPGYESGLKVYPKIDITETGQTPAEGIDVGVRDITYGGTGLYQGDKWFAGAEGLTGDVKVDVTAEGKTLFKDTMSKDDALNYILGLGEAEGDKFQIKSDEDFDNVQIVFKKKFNQGGRASLSNGGLAKILGV